MPSRHEQYIELPASAPGTTRLLKVVAYGEAAARPKAYLQAAIHADEVPGILVLHYLQALLDEADRDGRISGRVVIVPVANPVGSDQRIHGAMLGRYHFGDGINFNRAHADLAGQVAEAIDGRLGEDAETNRDLIRDELKKAVIGLPGFDDGAFLKRTLLSLAIDADICLDLHCDNEALLHMYCLDSSRKEAELLSAQLGCRALFLADESGGHPFDEAVSTPWLKLARHFPDAVIPPPPLSATVELRGLADVDPDTATSDARNLFTYLQRLGVIEGEAGPLPKALCEATPLSGVHHIRTGVAGVVLLDVGPGDRVEAGDVVARILEPFSPFGDGMTELKSGTSGLVYARTNHRMVAPGQIVVAVAGPQGIEYHPGALLLSD